MSEILPKGSIVFYRSNYLGCQFDYPRFLKSSKSNFLDYRHVPVGFGGDINDYYYDDPLLDMAWEYKTFPATIEQFTIYGPNAFYNESYKKDSTTIKMMILDVHMFKFKRNLQNLYFYECMYIDTRQTQGNSPRFFVRSSWVLPVTETCSSNVDYIKQKILNKIKNKRNI